MIGVVVPTVNEAARLPDLLRDLDRVRVPLDVVVVDGGSSDATLALAARAGVHTLSTPRGRAQQMNRGANAVRGEWLLFLHADSRLPAAARRILLGAMVEDPRPDAAVFRFAIDLSPGWKRFLESGQALRQAVYGLPYGDQGLLVRRSLFEAVGGFPEIPLLEDVALLRALRRRTRVRVLGAALVTSGRRYAEHGVLRTWLRHTTVIALYLAGVAPSRLMRLAGRAHP